MEIKKKLLVKDYELMLEEKHNYAHKSIEIR